ncbi:MAG TPA: adenylate/guanylate cyclase domain-containing protein [Aeromicrobium sp.]|nr:adenylate/guanylate cyclase domain-containing protein [Aeromicrobium sp.]
MTDVSEAIQNVILGEAPTLTRLEVAEQAGVDPAVSQALWRLLGFPQTADDDVAFTHADVEALRLSMDLMERGIVRPESQAALVRTLARSFARLAEWQTRLIAEIAEAESIDDDAYVALTADVLPRIEQLQNYIWHRHLASASASLLMDADAAAGAVKLTVGFVDIVGYTSLSKELDEAELIEWVEHFEDQVTGVVVDHGGHVIKTIGDEALFVVDAPRQAAEIGLILAARGSDADDPFPAVRVGLAYGDVVRRLGDVFGSTVNIAARLTSIGRPGTVIADHGVHDLLCSDHAPADTRAEHLTMRRLPRMSVKGYSKLESWAVRRGGA